MKKTILFSALCLMVLAAFTSGCKRGAVTCPTCENYATLQGTIMDAVTGERIGGKATIGRRDTDTGIEIFLIQGATIRTPTSFISDPDNPLVGEYAFTNIPAGGSHNGGADPNDSENNEYKLVVIKEGYQQFEGKVNLVDIDNKIGNVYLFPEGYHAPDYTFQVVYNGAPVDNATVLFQPYAGSNDITTDSSDVLAATAGYLPSLKAFTDSAGYVTFPGWELALGAGYRVNVLPKVFEGVPLALYQDGASRIIGLAAAGNEVTDIIAMADLVFGNIYGLYVAEISSSVLNQVDSTGTLEIVFSRPVNITGNFGAIETSIAGVLNATPVTHTLSADGLTLTLTPSWATPPGGGETSISITYTNGGAVITVQGYPGTSYSFNTLVDANGTAIDRTVILAGP